MEFWHTLQPNTHRALRQRSDKSACPQAGLYKLRSWILGHKVQSAVSSRLPGPKAPPRGDPVSGKGPAHYNYPGRSEKAPANSNHSVLAMWWFSHELKARKYWIIRYEDFYESKNPDGWQVTAWNGCWYLIAVLEFYLDDLKERALNNIICGLPSPQKGILIKTTMATSTTVTIWKPRKSSATHHSQRLYWFHEVTMLTP